MQGSPPHTWRILNDDAIGALGLRITSTYVENTNRFSSSGILPWDHLHIRGEYKIFKFRWIRKMGSPPHTWRILIWMIFTAVKARITSTYVENTVILTETKILERDHLHIRGEYWFCRNKVIQDLGSPPHTWRIQYLLPSSPNGKGITSTYVENTQRS